MTGSSEDRLRVLHPHEEIQKRVQELGAAIDRDYPNGELFLICILKGAFMFMGDLSRSIRRDVRCEFIAVSSYGKAKSTSGEVRLTKDLDSSIEGADVVVVEDIVDTGITLSYLIHILSQRRPRSIRIAALLDKPSRRVRPIRVDYRGFEIPDDFVVGYGLDHAEKYRNLPDICLLEPAE